MRIKVDISLWICLFVVSIQVYLTYIFLRKYYKRWTVFEETGETSSSNHSMGSFSLKHVFKSSPFLFLFGFLFFNKRIGKKSIVIIITVLFISFSIIQPTSYCHSCCQLHSAIPKLLLNGTIHSIDVLWLENNIEITMKNKY